MRILAPVGTLPEAIKLIPLLGELEILGAKVDVALTRQASCYVDCCFKRGSIAYRLNNTYSQGLIKNVEYMNEDLCQILNNKRYNYIISVGDTSTAYSANLVGMGFQIPTIHLESGMRSGCISRPFPEEYYRRSIDAMCSVHCCFDEHDIENLQREGISGISLLSYSTIYDAVDNSIGGEYIFTPRRAVVIHLHRRELRRQDFDFLIERIVPVCKAAGREIYLLKNRRFQIDGYSCVYSDFINIINIMSHVDYIKLISSAELVVTDSGTLQEEAWALGVPAIIFRRETERPYLLEVGRSFLDFDARSVASCLEVAFDTSVFMSKRRYRKRVGGARTIAKYITREVYP